MIELKNLEKSFGGKKAVAGVTCSFEEGRITGLIGPNGAGKTTVFNMITGLIKPTAGTVLVNGQDITGLRPHKVARMGIARGFQRMRLFHALTARENVMVALPAVSHHLIPALMSTGRKKAAMRAEADGFLEKVGVAPLGDRKASELSYGDQRSVMLACLLASGARILMLDEPTGGIDPTSREKVLQQIIGLREQGHTIILVEHNLDVVRGACETVFFLAEGRVRASGTPAEIEADPQLTKIYFGAGHA